ncbi:hypothetical protein [Paraoerskovia marina]|uniref:hypothetical protein n=1 Tax=Paraoerskovia marina TaxID=545619 RepID=UPI000492AD61|nr:hypothetical protein [Paraoerskovia marina]
MTRLDPSTLRLRTRLVLDTGDTGGSGDTGGQGLRGWRSTLRAVDAHGTAVELGDAHGLLVNLAYPAAGEVLAALAAVDDDAAALGATLFGLRANARGLKGTRLGIAVRRASVPAPHRGLGLGAVLLAQSCDLLGFGHPTLPVVLVPFPDGGADLPSTVLADVRDKVETAATEAGFSPAAAAAGGPLDVEPRHGSPWWRLTTRTGGRDLSVPTDDVVDHLVAHGREP